MRLGLLGSLQMNFDKLSMLHTVCSILYADSIQILYFKNNYLVLMWLRGLLGVPAEKQKLWKHHFATTAEMDSNVMKARYL